MVGMKFRLFRPVNITVGGATTKFDHQLAMKLKMNIGAVEDEKNSMVGRSPALPALGWKTAANEVMKYIIPKRGRTTAYDLAKNLLSEKAL